MNKIYFLVIIYFLINFSCSGFLEKEIDLNKNFEPKPVVECFISPQSNTVFLYLSRNAPFDSGDNGSYKIDNAIISISDQEQTYFFELDTIGFGINQRSKYLCYVPQNFFQVSKTYKLELKVEGMETCFAEATVPPAIPLSHIKTETVISNGERLWNAYFEPLENVENYVFGQYETLEVPQLEGRFINKIEAEILPYNINTNGFIPVLKNLPIPQNSEENEIYYYIGVSDQNLYEFYLNTRINILTGEDPFSQFAPIYSNIENGLGYFGAINFGNALVFE